MIGGLTPSFGSMMFTCVSITGCKMQEFIKECVPFIIALLIALLLLTAYFSMLEVVAESLNESRLERLKEQGS